MNKLEIVAKDMIHNMVIPDELIEQLNNIFFSFCRHHKIKQGTPYYKDGELIGYTCARYDWTMVRECFLKQVESKLELSTLFDIPEDLKG